MKYSFSRYTKKIVSLLLAVAVTHTNMAQMNPLPVGAIQPGDSIVIIYDVTINNPLPGGTTQISNQGSVAGSNFVTFNTNDPKTPTAGDPTIILLNVVLPVRLIELTATEKNNTIVLNWKANAEKDMARYEVEKSADGINFTKIGEVAARNTTGTLSYSYTDLTPFGGMNYYRLRMVDRDGSGKNSQILRISLHDNNRSVQIFPNPVIGSTFTLQFANVPQDNYTLEVYNSVGSRVFTQVIKHSGRSSSQTIRTGVLPAGVYQIAIKGAAITFTKTVVVQ